MKRYTTLNILFGWLVFLIAAITYLLTLEPTASYWDCGEFIAASYKLEVGHPPGAPFFLLIGRLFTLFAGANREIVPVMVNALSGLASAFTILFLFWTITHLVKKIMHVNEEEMNLTDKLVILGSGFVGSLAYTFSDTFWFSAVEGEVYASSSLFTAVVFWAILKWENIADTKYANRWLVLIAYLMGLSVGVHLLNLLAIPAIVLIYYFKKYSVTRKGVILALLIAAGILGGIMYILIPGLVKFAAVFERLFINGFGLPYFSGLLVYLILLLGIIIGGLLYTQKHRKVLANTVILVISVIIIGYSSYAMIVIRSAANPPMDQNNPENLFNLLSYLNREQYGDRPLLYGQYFNTPIVKELKGKPVFVPENGKYKIASYKPRYKYDSNYMTLLPRMYSNQPDHIDAYLSWTGLEKSDFFEARTDRSGKEMKDRYGEVVYDYNKPKDKVGFKDNIVFLFRYQLGYMYFRYFMWNFSGRQNDIQGNYKEEITSGNWITGIKFLDSARLGNQSKLPEVMLKNKARNRFFLLPLVLGLIGFFFHFKADQKNFWVVFSLFFFTGIAIVLYLNQNPLQPRERDYAYAGSFYAFTIWIGMAVVALYKTAREAKTENLSKFTLKGFIVVAVLGIFDFASTGRLTYTWTLLVLLIFVLMFLLISVIFGRLVKNRLILALLLVLLCLPIPLLMAVQNWNDHDRSGRYVARDFASNYLNSCEKNSILYTNGDNDTFPLWYVQEVEGVRTDIRVINLSYLSAEWYIDQMSLKAYESEPVKMTLQPRQYQQGIRDITYLYDRVNGYIDLNEAIQFVANDEVQQQLVPGIPEPIYYIPQHQFRLKADSVKVLSNGTIKPEMIGKFTPELRWQIGRSYLTKNHLMALDFLATNQWERPICYAITVGNENYLGLDDYFEMRGLAYRIIPANIADGISYAGGINTSLMFENMMHKFRWGGIEEGEIYLDENCQRMFSNMRHNFASLATALIKENKIDSAFQVIEKCVGLFPDELLPYDMYMLSFVESCYIMGKDQMARDIADEILKNTYDNLTYYMSLDERYSSYLQMDKRIAAHVISELVRTSHEHGDKKYSASIQQRLEDFGPGLNSIFN
jgi:hypothetical protein